jgi:hypothetical protein
MKHHTILKKIWCCNNLFVFEVAFVIVILKKISFKKVWLVRFRYSKNYD